MALSPLEQAALDAYTPAVKDALGATLAGQYPGGIGYSAPGTGPAYDPNMVVRFDTGNKVSIPDGHGGWTERNSAALVFQPGQTYVLKSSDGKVLGNASTPEELQALTAAADKQGSKGWDLYNTDPGSNSGSPIYSRSPKDNTLLYVLAAGGALMGGAALAGVGAAGGGAAGGAGLGGITGSSAAAATLPGLAGTVVPVAGGVGGTAITGAGGLAGLAGGLGTGTVVPVAGGVGAAGGGAAAGGLAGITGSSAAAATLPGLAGTVVPVAGGLGSEIVVTAPIVAGSTGLGTVGGVAGTVGTVGGAGSLGGGSSAGGAPEGTGNPITVSHPPVPPPNTGTVGAGLGGVGAVGSVTNPLDTTIGSDGAIEVHNKPPVTGVPNLPPVIPPVVPSIPPVTTPPATPTTPTTPADPAKPPKSPFPKMSVSDWLRLAGLLTGTVGNAVGGNGGGTIPGGFGNPSGAFTDPNLGPPTIPGLTPGTGGTRNMSGTDWAHYGENPEQSFFNYVPPTSKHLARGGLAYAAAPTQPSGLSHVSGPGDGREDKIPSMLSDGEYVMDAETVALLGNGSNKAGAQRLDVMRSNIRKQKGKSLAKGGFSVKAKHPEAYLKGGLNG